MKHLSLVFLLAAGCSVVRMSDREHGVAFTAYMPAWPWQDSTKAVERVNLSARTNGFTASLRGLSESETTTTNASALVESIVGAAVRAAAGR